MKLDNATSPYRELRQRLLFVLIGIRFRVGAHIPLPGIDLVQLKEEWTSIPLDGLVS